MRPIGQTTGCAMLLTLAVCALALLDVCAFPAFESKQQQYGIVIDCGSSGTRVHLYHWNMGEDYSDMLLSVAPVFFEEKLEPATYKITPGVSSLATANKDTIFKYIDPLIQFAQDYIPTSSVASTGVFILATAGMRLLEAKKQDSIMQTLKERVKSYKFGAVETRVIAGSDEGMYQWISVNAKEHVFTNYLAENLGTRTHGIIEMGGASLQITYQLRPGGMDFIENQAMNDKLRKIFGKQLARPAMARQGTADKDYVLFSTTFLGFGTNSAQQNYIDYLVTRKLSENPQTRHDIQQDIAKQAAIRAAAGGGWLSSFGTRFRYRGSMLDDTVQTHKINVDDPCLPSGIVVKEDKPIEIVNAKGVRIGYESSSGPKITVHRMGTGNYQDCKDDVKSMLQQAKRQGLHCGGKNKVEAGKSAGLLEELQDIRRNTNIMAANTDQHHSAPPGAIGAGLAAATQAMGTNDDEPPTLSRLSSVVSSSNTLASAADLSNRDPLSCTMELLGHQLIPNNEMDLIGIGDVNYTVSSYGSKNYDPKALRPKMAAVCSSNLEQIKKLYPKLREDHAKSLCFRSVWVETFLTDGINFGATNTLRVTDKINGFPIEWPLGALIDKVLDRESSFISQSRRVGRSKSRRRADTTSKTARPQHSSDDPILASGAESSSSDDESSNYNSDSDTDSTTSDVNSDSEQENPSSQAHILPPNAIKHTHGPQLQEDPEEARNFGLFDVE